MLDSLPESTIPDRKTVDAEIDAGDRDTGGRGAASSRVDPRGTATTSSRMSPRQTLLFQSLWLLVALTMLAVVTIGAPLRYHEMQVPCADPTTCFVAQLTVAEQDALAEMGVPMSTYIGYLEGIAGLMMLLCTASAAVIYWRRRDKGIAVVVSMFLLVVSTYVTFHADAIGRAYPAAAPLSGLVYGATTLLVAWLLFTFPSGHFSPPWTRWLLAAWGLYNAVWVLFPGLTLSGDTPLPMLLQIPNVAMFLLGLALQVVRYRTRSTPVQRQQTKLITIALVGNIAVFATVAASMRLVPLVTGHQLFADPRANLAWSFALYHLYVISFLMIPMTLLFSVLRYRLWDIDILINRSLAYGGLTAALAALFAGCVLALQQLSMLVTDGAALPWVIGISALVVGLLFQPTRRALQRLIDHRLYGIAVDYAAAEIDMRRRSAMPLRPVDQHAALSQFHDFELIGRGGMAHVYRADHVRLNRPFAIKVLPPESIERDERALKRFEREARIISGLDHDNIVTMHDFGTTEDGSRYIVMQYIGGGDLEQLLRQRGRLPYDEALPLLRDIGRALDYAHAHDIVHRDIKPSNVLIEPIDATDPERTQRAVLTDFGIAKLTSETAMTATSVMGTLDYMSPEQINDSKRVDGRADVYSLGAMAYRVLTGDKPFNSYSRTALLIAHLQQPPVDPRQLVPSIPRHAARAILRALAKDPDDRQPSVGHFIAELQGEERPSGGMEAARADAGAAP